MATTNMQMQTFVTQPDEAVEGFDGYNGDLTSRQAGSVGGQMVKKMIKAYEDGMK